MQGKGPIRTGVTAILPRGKAFDPVFAATHVQNGNGDMTGTHWIGESGFLETPLLITNTGSVGVVRDAALGWMSKHKYFAPLIDYIWFAYPVVGETYDGVLNDMYGFHVKPEHVESALDGARGGQVAEGNVGGGTAMSCLGFKCGTGTSSRVVEAGGAKYTVGALVQANFGGRRPADRSPACTVGREIKGFEPKVSFALPPQAKEDAGGRGSIIAIVATDAPLLPHQLRRIALRIGLGVGRTGGTAGNGSGDIFLAFSTANKGAAARGGLKGAVDAVQRRHRSAVRRDRRGDRGSHHQRARRRPHHDRHQRQYPARYPARSSARHPSQIRTTQMKRRDRCCRSRSVSRSLRHPPRTIRSAAFPMMRWRRSGSARSSSARFPMRRG